MSTHETFNLNEFIQNRKAAICIEHGKSWNAVLNNCVGKKIWDEPTLEQTIQELVEKAKQIEL